MNSVVSLKSSVCQLSDTHFSLSWCASLPHRYHQHPQFFPLVCSFVYLEMRAVDFTHDMLQFRSLELDEARELVERVCLSSGFKIGGVSIPSILSHPVQLIAEDGSAGSRRFTGRIIVDLGASSERHPSGSVQVEYLDAAQNNARSIFEVSLGGGSLLASAQHLVPLFVDIAIKRKAEVCRVHCFSLAYFPWSFSLSVMGQPISHKLNASSTLTVSSIT